MNSILNYLANTKVIVVSFVLMILIGVGFGVFADAVGGKFLDAEMSGDAAIAALANLTDVQKSNHFWLTLLLDTAYPIAYGAFFIGAIARLAGPHRSWAIWPNAIGVDCDFVENIVQMMALSGNPDWLFLKDVLSPVKMAALAIGLLLIIGFGIRAFLQRKKAPAAS